MRTLVARHGLHGTSMAAVAAEAGRGHRHGVRPLPVEGRPRARRLPRAQARARGGRGRATRRPSRRRPSGSARCGAPPTRSSPPSPSGPASSSSSTAPRSPPAPTRRRWRDGDDPFVVEATRPDMAALARPAAARGALRPRDRTGGAPRRQRRPALAAPARRHGDRRVARDHPAVMDCPRWLLSESASIGLLPWWDGRALDIGGGPGCAPGLAQRCGPSSFCVTAQVPGDLCGDTCVGRGESVAHGQRGGTDGCPAADRVGVRWGERVGVVPAASGSRERRSTCGVAATAPMVSAGLSARSRAPRTSPQRIGADVEDAIVALRKELTDLGVDAGPAHDPVASRPSGNVRRAVAGDDLADPRAPRVRDP